MINHTIIEKVRSMLKTIKLSKAFWDEATQTAYYLINKSPPGPLNFEVPENSKRCFLFPLKGLWM